MYKNTEKVHHTANNLYNTDSASSPTYPAWRKRENVVEFIREI